MKATGGFLLSLNSRTVWRHTGGWTELCVVTGPVVCFTNCNTLQTSEWTFRLCVEESRAMDGSFRVVRRWLRFVGRFSLWRPYLPSVWTVVSFRVFSFTEGNRWTVTQPWTVECFQTEHPELNVEGRKPKLQTGLSVQMWFWSENCTLKVLFYCKLFTCVIHRSRRDECIRRFRSRSRTILVLFLWLLWNVV